MFFSLLMLVETGSDGRAYECMPMLLLALSTKLLRRGLSWWHWLVQCVAAHCWEAARAAWGACLLPARKGRRAAEQVTEVGYESHGSGTPRSLLYVILNRLVISALTSLLTGVFLAHCCLVLFPFIQVLWQYLIVRADGTSAFTKS